jgi:hypothetical protein
MIALAARNSRIPLTPISPHLAAISAEREAILAERNRLLDLLHRLQARLWSDLQRLQQRMSDLTGGSGGKGPNGHRRPSPELQRGDPFNRSRRGPRDMG